MKININWKSAWKGLNFKYVNIFEREIIFKFLHGILTNKLRLFNIKKIASPLCDRCNVVEDNIHMFSNCKKVENLVLYFKNVMKLVCDIKSFSMKELLYLQNKASNKLQRNTQIVLTSTFIATIWYNRDNINDIDIANFKMKLLSHFKVLSLIPILNMNMYFTEKYCRLPEILFPP